MDFIPAKESALFSRVFRVYTKWLFKRRFENIWMHQEYYPGKADRTVYYLNHSSWWDGLIPFLLNEYCFHQQARAIMEYKQMKTYPFFKKLGAFSIKTNDRAHTLASMKYAIESMQRPHASLFIYPEGEIVPVGSELHFKNGISWLQHHVPEVHIVPIGIYMHTIRHDKPELHLWVGAPVEITPAKKRMEITALFEEALEQILAKLKTTAGYDDELYEPLF